MTFPADHYSFSGSSYSIEFSIEFCILLKKIHCLSLGIDRYMGVALFSLNMKTHRTKSLLSFLFQILQALLTGKQFVSFNFIFVGKYSVP